MNTIGERIGYLRESKHLSQRELMEVLGFSNLSRIEKNERMPGIEIVISISKFFNVSTDWILTGENSNRDVNRHRLSDQQKKLISNFSKLTIEEQCKIEGIIEGFSLSHDMQSSKRGKSSTSTHGEEAASDETA